MIKLLHLPITTPILIGGEAYNYFTNCTVYKLFKMAVQQYIALVHCVLKDPCLHARQPRGSFKILDVRQSCIYS